MTRGCEDGVLMVCPNVREFVQKEREEREEYGCLGGGSYLRYYGFHSWL